MCRFYDKNCKSPVVQPALPVSLQALLIWIIEEFDNILNRKMISCQVLDFFIHLSDD